MLSLNFSEEKQKRVIINVRFRKKRETPIAQGDDQEEQYFENIDELKQNEESVCFEFKRMRISDDLDETLLDTPDKTKKKHKLQTGEFFYSYDQHNQIFQESLISHISSQKSEKYEENPQIENSSYHSDVSQEYLHIIQIDEINYINPLTLQNQQRIKKTNKFKGKKTSQTNFSHLPMKTKVISK